MAVALTVPTAVVAVVLLIFGAVLAWVLLLFVAALAERQHLLPFGPDPLAVYPADLPPYLPAMNASLNRHGFEYGGTYADSRAGVYHVYATLWFSPDRSTVVLVGGGTILRMPYKATSLTSVTADGRHVITKDEFDAGEYSGIVERERVLNGDFDELWDAHQRRLAMLPEGAWRFPPAYTPYAAEVTLRHVRVEEARARGYVRWVDPAHGTYRYTVKAALRISVPNFFGDLFKAMGESSRASRPRPGDAMPAFPVALAGRSEPDERR